MVCLCTSFWCTCAPTIIPSFLETWMVCCITSFSSSRIWKIIRHQKCIWQVRTVYQGSWRKRISISGILLFVISLGIQKGYQAVAWFGSLSYGKLHVEKEPRITKCPLRNGEFEEIYHEGPFHPIIP